MSQDDEPQISPPPSLPIAPGSFVFGPRPVAVTSLLVAVACLGTLVIVATQKNVDALSTIALALAILAFAAQLIIYIAQSATSTQQLYLSQVVQAETARMLAGIQATTDAQFAAIDRIIPRLVSTATAEQLGESKDGEGSSDPEAVEHARAEFARVTEQLAAIVREELAKAAPPSAPLGGSGMIPLGSYGGSALYPQTVVIDRTDPRAYTLPIGGAAREATNRNPYLEAAEAKRRYDAGEPPFHFAKSLDDVGDHSTPAEENESEPRNPPPDPPAAS